MHKSMGSYGNFHERLYSKVLFEEMWDLPFNLPHLSHYFSGLDVTSEDELTFFKTTQNESLLSPLLTPTIYYEIDVD